MKASYRVMKTPEHLVKMGTAQYTIDFIVGGATDWEYARRAKIFHETEAAANEAGKRYLRKMKKNGFEV